MLTIMIGWCENLCINGFRRQAQQGGIPWRLLHHLWQSLSSWLLFFTLHDGAPTNNGSKKGLGAWLP